MPVYPTRPTQRKEEDRHRLEGEARRPKPKSKGVDAMLKPYYSDDQGTDGVTDGSADQGGADVQQIHWGPPSVVCIS
jgi:hypothetical protein